MNIQFKHKVNGCNSIIETSYALQTIDKEFVSLLTPKQKEYLSNSPVPLVVTIIANPNEVELDGAFKHNDSIWSILSNKIASDVNLYSLRNKLSSICPPESIDCVLIAIGIEEYNCEIAASTPSDEDDDKPVFILKEPKFTFDDVLLDKDTKERILRALSIIENKELIFDKWGFSKIDKATKSILCFYGAAGTGKTMTAEAIGSYLNKKIVHSSYAQIESKWVGEGAKNLHSIFDFAEANDAVLFFDEADSFLSNRIESTSGSSDKHYNRMSNELFQLLEEFNGCVVFATNLLTDVDKAFKSRIIDSIKFSLPDLETRVTLIKRMIPCDFPIYPSITNEQFKELSLQIEGFSGRDIRKAILLSLAGASIKAKVENVKTFNFDDIKAGFEEVISYKEKMAAEEGVLPPSLVQDIADNQKKNENMVDMAIYAMYSDGVLHESEKQLIQEYSRGLLGVNVEEPISLPEKKLCDICNDAIKGGYTKELLDTAIRVISIDGYFVDDERIFLADVINYLDIPKNRTETIMEYTQKMASLNNEWVTLSLYGTNPE